MSSAQGKGVEISIGSSSDFVSPCLPVSLSQGRNLSSSLSRRLTVCITREGWAWLVLAGILWGTGLYKGINLLSFLGLLMLAAWMIQWLGARRRLSHLGLRRWTDNLVFAETPFTLTVEVSNPDRQARFGLVVEDQGADHFWSSFIPRLEGKAKSQLHADMVLGRRGIYAWPALRARSGFPLGLVEQRLTVGTDEEFVVFPRLGRLHRSQLRRMLTHSSSSLGRARTHPRRHPAAQSDFHGLRAFRSGDSPHWIHWRTSARLGELMVREFEETPDDNLVLVLDPWLPSSGDRSQESGVRGQGSNQSPLHQVLEDAVSLAATICWEWCRPGGDQFVLAVADKNPIVLHGVTGHDLGVRMLTCLAQVSGTSEPDIDRLVASLRPILPPGPILLLSTRSGDMKTILEQELHRPVTSINVMDVAELGFFEWESEPGVRSQRSEINGRNLLTSDI